MTLPVGIFLFANQEYLFGFILSVLGIGAIIVALSPRFTKSLENRKIPTIRGYVMAFGFGAAAVATALFVFLFIQPSTNLLLIGSVYALGILVLGTWSVIQVLGSMRS